MISVILPTYNCADYLDRSINSVIRQTYPEWELLIIDDGSTDNTKEICKYYIDRFKNIKYFYQKNSGVSKARNKGISLSEGKYICFLDSDDYYETTFLESLRHNIKEYDIAYSGFSYKRDSLKKESIDFSARGSILHEYLYSISEQNHPFCICSILIKREFLDKNNIYFSEGIKNCEDTEFIIKTLEKGQAIRGGGALFIYLQGREGSATSVNSYKEQIFSILNTFKRIYNNTQDENKSIVSYVIRKEISYWINFLLNKKLRRNILLIIDIIIWKLKNKSIIG